MYLHKKKSQQRPVIEFADAVTSSVHVETLVKVVIFDFLALGDSDSR